VLARREAEGAAQVKSAIRIGSTDYDAATAVGIGGTAYSYTLFPYDTNPATSAAFSESEVNAAEFGVLKTA
jgi:hypothetical protein